MTVILGISGYFHDSSVCLVIDDEIVEFVKEESLTRIKGINSFPIRALNYLLEQYNLNNGNIDYIAFYEQPLRAWAATIHHSIKTPWKSRKLLSMQIKDFWNGPISFSGDLKKVLNFDNKKIFYVPHHLSHALSTLPFTPKPFSDAPSLQFVLDGVGDGYTQSVFIYRDGNVDCIHRMQYPHSLGLFYSTITDFCGFSINEGEQKLMALAAYGKPKYLDFFRNELTEFNIPNFKLKMKYFEFNSDPEKSFNDNLINELGSPLKSYEIKSPNTEAFQRAADIAASTQKLTEEFLIKFVKWGIEKTGISSIGVSGGVAQNSVALSKLQNLNEIECLTISPSPGDSGAALGATNFVHILKTNKSLTAKKLSYGTNQLKNKMNLFKKYYDPYPSEKSTLETICDLLRKGEILCCYLNGQEIGPRALCDRSLICAGNNQSSIKELNEIIKKREQFRPLAPVMRPNIVEKYFKLWNAARHNYQWMALTAEAKKSFPISYQNVLHVDKSARIQILSDDTHLISNVLDNLFGEIDILINTSFNIAGDPIVFDLIDCFVNMKRMGLKFLLTDQGLYEIKHETLK